MDEIKESATKPIKIVFVHDMVIFDMLNDDHIIFKDDKEKIVEYSDVIYKYTLKDTNKVIRDGKVAVLYSPGFGAGWSTWASFNREQLIFEPTIVELVEKEEHYKITDELMEDLGFEDVYIGGAYQLRIEWIPIGTRFIIEEYDGSESIRFLDTIEFYTA